MPHARRRKRIRIGLAAATFMSLGAASAGTAMGWVMGGTEEAIRQFETRAKSPVADSGNGGAATPPAPPVSASPTSVEAETAYGKDAWTPQNNTVQWSVPIPPAQPLSGVVIHNAEERTNVIAHFALRNTSGAWTPIASMTIAPRSDAVLHPPAGDYSMTIVSAPVGMTFDQVARLKPSAATMLRLLPVTMGSSDGEPVRMMVAEGVVKPGAADPNASTTALASRTTVRRPASAPKTYEEPMLVASGGSSTVTVAVEVESRNASGPADETGQDSSS